MSQNNSNKRYSMAPKRKVDMQVNKYKAQVNIVYMTLFLRPACCGLEAYEYRQRKGLAERPEFHGRRRPKSAGKCQFYRDLLYI